MKKPKYCKDCKRFERASGLCCFEKPEVDTVTGIKRIRIYKKTLKNSTLTTIAVSSKRTDQHY